MHLSRTTLTQVKDPRIVPPAAVLALPERVLQFGTGVLLRGLPDYFIDTANRQGLFNGRVVVVKSTGAGDSGAFGRQDSLYTHVIRGIEEGRRVEETRINSSISRVLTAGSEWDDVLACAADPAISIVISNTTEVGIQLDPQDRITLHPPASFPGKLLAVLHTRFKKFDGDPQLGLTIIPTELIVDNGKKLKAIVNELAARNGLGNDFIQWLNTANTFCSSLVDRIVPGKPDSQVTTETAERLGYTDDLLIVSEPYRLWAIEGDANVRAALSFAEADKGVVIAPDIEIYRELKLRLLNGAHTLSCGIALLSGFRTVREAMENPAMSAYISALMTREIAPAIPYQISEAEKLAFANTVLDRFRNPSIEHLWHAITAQFSAKLKLRIVPVLLHHYKQAQTPPPLIAAGFAAWLRFMNSAEKDGAYYCRTNGQEYRITDDAAALLHALWQENGEAGIARRALAETALWDADLGALPGFADAVQRALEQANYFADENIFGR